MPYFCASRACVPTVSRDARFADGLVLEDNSLVEFFNIIDDDEKREDLEYLDTEKGSKDVVLFMIFVNMIAGSSKVSEL